MLHVQGAAFALHQIRHMIGAAIAVAQGTVPADVMRIALHTPFQAGTMRMVMHMPWSCIHHEHAYAVRAPCIYRASTAHASCMRHACAHVPLQVDVAPLVPAEGLLLAEVHSSANASPNPNPDPDLNPNPSPNPNPNPSSNPTPIPNPNPNPNPNP